MGVEPKEENKDEEDDEEEEGKKEETPDEKYEDLKKNKVKAILQMEYLLFIKKTFRVILFVAAILIALFTAFWKCNVWGAFVLFFAAIFSFSSVNFKNVKWFTLFF